MTYARVGVVSGANKGVGYGIVRQLALQYPKSGLDSGSLLIYIAARDQGRGEAAVKNMLEDAQLKKAKALFSDGGLTDIKFHPLDIAESRSIQDFKNFLDKEHPDGLDFVINNAGTAMDGFNNHIVETTLRCNYHGTLEATKDFIPLLKPTGRLVNIASIAGKLNKYSPTLVQRFLDSASPSPKPSTPEAAATRLMDDFTNAVRRGKQEDEGWPSAAYAVSKAGVVAMTKAIAAAEKEKGNTALINVCCPGWVVTDMTKGRGTKTIDEGAQTPVMLAIGDFGGKTGELWRDEKLLLWQ